MTAPRAQETETSIRAESGALWRREPFRVFLPLGVVLGWVGVSHWLLYFSGVISTYSCMLHGLIQTQAFMMAFALGFLLTPRAYRASALAVAALLWLIGSATWLVFLGPRLLRGASHH